MDKTARLNELFEEWKRKRPNRFNADGILDEARWLVASRRVLFLLKETNDFDGDLRELEFPSAGWLPLGYWAHALHATTPDSVPSFSIPRSNDSIWQEARQASAFMNLKKTTGTGSSIMASVKSVAIEDSEFLCKELEIIDPQIVVACGPGMMELARQVFGLVSTSVNGYRWELHDGVTWIDFFHPSGRYPHFMYYYSLACIYQESLSR